jgi:LysR family transcriptional regulator, glycine cleavage system transcriptional activator
MTIAAHLKSLQAVELAIRAGSLKGAADRLGITPAAVGQRVRALEDFLGTDLLVRGRSGLQPTTSLSAALADLQSAFAALERVGEALEFQRVAEIHVVADLDWAELWLEPRLAAFRRLHPNVRFCVNGSSGLPLRLGAPDVRVFYGDGQDEPLFTDVFLPIASVDILRRVADKEPSTQMEGMPLLHLESHPKEPGRPGWIEWFRAYGRREIGPDRGVRHRRARQALEAVRQNVGFLVCGLSLVQNDLENGSVFNPFPMSQHLPAPHPYRLQLRGDAARRPPVQKFAAWLRAEAAQTRAHIETSAAQAGA